MSTKATTQDVFNIKVVIALISALEKQPNIDKTTLITDILSALEAGSPRFAQELQQLLVLRALPT